ncbi:hypothetical protein PG991_006861 [Apiospora marii]|uniref:non-specific serine/threonine protein kinase n=1 Tax=Apiospora marii TaxID=335849 RepID=A0ABR1RYH0_9PEZI
MHFSDESLKSEETINAMADLKLKVRDLTTTIVAMGPLDLSRWVKVLVEGVQIVYVEVDDGALPFGWQERAAASITAQNPVLTLPPFPGKYFMKSNYMGLTLSDSPPGRRTVWIKKEPFDFLGGQIPVWDDPYFDYTRIRKTGRITNGNGGRIFERIWTVEVTIAGVLTKALMKVTEFPAGISSNFLDRHRARDEADKLQKEIRMHQQAAAGAPDIVPAFLGVVTDLQRGVVGFLQEYIEDVDILWQVKTKEERAALKPMVRAAIEKLHNEARMTHGDLHDENVLIKKDRSRLYLVDFEQAEDMRVEGDFEVAMLCDYTVLQ